MKKNLSDLPDINKRVKNLIDDVCDGNVSRFSLKMGLSDGSKVNRLFNKDKRTGDYPMPSTDIILMISNTFNVSTDWLLKGVGEDSKSVNNITISKHNVNGNNNTTIGNENKGVSLNENSDLMGIIKAQQEQINNLISVITNGK